MKKSYERNFTIIVCTEITENNQKLIKCILEYYFNAEQIVELKWLDPRGRLFVFVAPLPKIIVKANEHQYPAELVTSNREKFDLVLFINELSNCKKTTEIVFRGFIKNLKWYHLFISSGINTILLLLKDGDGDIIQSSEVIKSSKKPIWKMIISPREQCVQPTYKLKIQCNYVSNSNSVESFGSYDTSLEQLSMGPEHNKYGLFRMVENQKKDIGTMEMTEFKMTMGEKSFVDYFQQQQDQKKQIIPAFGIDFTEPNKHWMQPDSLHHLSNDGKINNNEDVLGSIGNILKHYNNRKRYQAFGK